KYPSPKPQPDTFKGLASLPIQKFLPQTTEGQPTAKSRCSGFGEPQPVVHEWTGARPLQCPHSHPDNRVKGPYRRKALGYNDRQDRDCPRRHKSPSNVHHTLSCMEQACPATRLLLRVFPPP